jgi:NADP-reducing hydrogenase subunit HndD
MTCTAKKFEAERPEFARNGVPDVDVAITTRELARMIKIAGIDFKGLTESHFDDPMGDATGAAVLFGATGGVMEAALRTVAEILDGKELENIEFDAVRGVTGIKEARVKAGGMIIKAAVAHGLANARELMERIQSGEADYHFIEIMACPGGCVNGGGQPIQPSSVWQKIDVRKERARAIYEEDANLSIRKSHQNPNVEKLYKEFLGEPGGHMSHELLHTHYHERKFY